ncbi:methyltransferase [Actinorhabdospora filicis]|uniref:Methyltransferase n=1 Tax=Actinorhabdospora filicis TaxID=1785913 RepID=A0A9W6SPN9_9ACTN|nr:class I SAM-dependent methyltransferase [Actinorhabdospora filicis]GLZ80073.1 methyltransferase [Actinorhabdospora filicis]
MTATYTDAEAAALYDVLNPWDPAEWPGDAFYAGLIEDAESVLDVGCGTGQALAHARAAGHTGRLAGIDPDAAALDVARARAEAEWVLGTAANIPWTGEFELAFMTGHAFQFIPAAELDRSLRAIRAALRPGGRFAFETRHPQARAWEHWIPANEDTVTDAAGRVLRVWHDLESVTGDEVTFTGTTADPDGTVLRVERATLRFITEDALDTALAAAGFTVEARHGYWDGRPVDAASREIITIARA